MHVKPKRAPWTSTRTLACTSWSQGAANKIGRLADSINTKSAITSDAAYSAALHKAWFLACLASACSSSALLGTTSSAIKAWVLACIASAAAQTHCWAPSRRLSKPGSWHVSPAPAAHTHCLAPPHQLSQPGSGHASPAPAAVQLIRTPWYHLISYLHVSHRCNSNCCETVVLLTCAFEPQRSFDGLFVSFDGVFVSFDGFFCFF